MDEYKQHYAETTNCLVMRFSYQSFTPVATTYILRKNYVHPEKKKLCTFCIKVALLLFFWLARLFHCPDCFAVPRILFPPMQGYGKASLADFIAVFFHISHWYLSWITLAIFLFLPIQGYGKASPTVGKLCLFKLKSLIFYKPAQSGIG